jgi:ABC-type multidrug transport system fused ATPase/permease subunit
MIFDNNLKVYAIKNEMKQPKQKIFHWELHHICKLLRPFKPLKSFFQKIFGNLIQISWWLIGLSIVLFIWYLIVLIINGYINPQHNFDFGVAKDIGAFVGNFIAPFLTFAGTLLLIANLREVKKINEDNNYKVLTERAMELFKWYLTDLQKERKRLKRQFNVPHDNRENLHLHVPILPTDDQMDKIIKNPPHKFDEFFKHASDDHAPDIISYLLMLDYFAACVIEKHVNETMISKMLHTQFLNESRLMLLYIKYYQQSDNNFCQRVIELYLEWGGQIGTNGEKIIQRIQD